MNMHKCSIVLIQSELFNLLEYTAFSLGMKSLLIDYRGLENTPLVQSGNLRLALISKIRLHTPGRAIDSYRSA